VFLPSFKRPVDSTRQRIPASVIYTDYVFAQGGPRAEAGPLRALERTRVYFELRDFVCRDVCTPGSVGEFGKAKREIEEVSYLLEFAPKLSAGDFSLPFLVLKYMHVAT
jgi:hypothetical protein